LGVLVNLHIRMPSCRHRQTCRKQGLATTSTGINATTLIAGMLMVVVSCDAKRWLRKMQERQWQAPPGKESLSNDLATTSTGINAATLIAGMPMVAVSWDAKRWFGKMQEWQCQAPPAKERVSNDSEGYIIFLEHRPCSAGLISKSQA